MFCWHDHESPAAVAIKREETQRKRKKCSGRSSNFFFSGWRIIQLDTCHTRPQRSSHRLASLGPWLRRQLACTFQDCRDSLRQDLMHALVMSIDTRNEQGQWIEVPRCQQGREQKTFFGVCDCLGLRKHIEKRGLLIVRKCLIDWKTEKTSKSRQIKFAGERKIGLLQNL